MVGYLDSLLSSLLDIGYIQQLLAQYLYHGQMSAAQTFQLTRILRVTMEVVPPWYDTRIWVSSHAHMLLMNQLTHFQKERKNAFIFSSLTPGNALECISWR